MIKPDGPMTEGAPGGHNAAILRIHNGNVMITDDPYAKPRYSWLGSDSLRRRLEPGHTVDIEARRPALRTV